MNLPATVVPTCGCFALPSVVTVVRKMNLPATIGEDQPRPGRVAVHSMLDVFDHVSGRREWMAYFSSAGLGSNVSMWLGAPTMNRKITDFALGLKCGGLAASALTRSTADTGAGNIDASAIAPKPWAERTSTSRRVTAFLKCASLDIYKLVPIQ